MCQQYCCPTTWWLSLKDIRITKLYRWGTKWQNWCSECSTFLSHDVHLYLDNFTHTLRICLYILCSIIEAMWNLYINLSSTDRKGENDDSMYILAIGEFEHNATLNTITALEEAEDTSD